MIGRPMKKLYIIRHAKSSWKDMNLDDFDRPLNKRGKLNAPLMGEVLRSRGIKPDIILSSPALRAKTTAKTIAQILDYSHKILFIKEIYEASSSELNNIVKKLDKKHDVAFLLGHNPGFNDLVYDYVGLYENIPTCGVVEIVFDCEKWSKIDSTNAKLISFDYPKKHS